MNGLAVAVETGQKYTFASALDWPGWCRRAKGGDEQALEALLSYADRYAAVAARAGLTLPDDPVPHLTDRVTGGATTDFGAPGEPVPTETTALTAAAARRRADLVAAAWQELDATAAAAPEALRKGPRGGGRDTSAVVAHVVEAERAYARKIGVRIPPFDAQDPAARAVLRDALLEVLRQPTEGAPVIAGGWGTQYAARRIAWHVLDHAWEIADRSH